MIERNSFQRLRLLCMALALLLALGACSNPFGVEPDEPLLWTPEESYEVTIEGGRAWATIPYIFTNATGKTVYVVGCGWPTLEKRVAEGWLPVWTNRLCAGVLGPPMVIEAGAIYSDTLFFETDRVSSPLPGAAGITPGATYRLRWTRVFHNYDPDRRLDFGDPLPEAQRVSSPFTLRLAE
ncbi:MAG TPA: hypothetical protein VIL13_13290 [Longimicrobiales bacterium]|jgi:hypothetical protein